MSAAAVWKKLERLGADADPRWVASLLFAAALAVRLAALVVAPDAHLSSNATESILPGAELIQRGAFIGNPDFPMLVPPLTAAFVASIQHLFGPALVYVKIGQIALDACLVVLVYAIGRRTVGSVAALLGAVALIVYPFAVVVPLYIGTESLFGFLLAAALLGVAMGLEDDALAPFFAAGLALGLATLTRGTTLFLPIFLVVYFAWYFRGSVASRIIHKSALLLAGFALVLSPWTARNLIVHQAFIPSATSSSVLLAGSSELFWLIADRERELPKYFQQLRTEKGWVGPGNPTWVDKDRFYRRAAIEKYKERWANDPWSYGSFVAKKFARLWYATESGSNILPVIAINLPVYLLALYGLRRLWRDRALRSSLLVVVLAYFVFMHVAIFGYFRYMVPVMPYVILIAAYGASRLLAPTATARSRPAGA